MARDVPRNVLARRGVLVVVGVVLVGVLVSLRGNGTFGAVPHVRAEVATAGGALRSGSDVKMRGVIVGRVSEVGRSESGGVSIDIALSESDREHVPANVVARVLPATVFGTTFVDLVVRGSASAESIEAGAVIGPDESQETLELQQALDDIDRLVDALGPSELQSAIGSAARALDGRGVQLGRTVRTVDGFLDRVNPRMSAVRADLVSLAEATRVVGEVAPDLLEATDDGLVFLDTVVTQEAALTSLISGGTDLAVTAQRFLSRNQRHLVRWINDTGGLVDVLYDNRRAGITDAITVNLTAGGRFEGVLENGYIRNDGVLRTTLPAYYGARDRPSYTPARRTGISAMVGDRG